MKFIIKNRDGQDMFYTEHECCVPLDMLDSMASTGLVFYVDGKKMSASSVRSYFKDVKADISAVTSEKKFEPKFIPVDVVLEVETKKSTKTISLIPKKKDESKIDLSKVSFPITSRCVVCLQNNKVYKNQKEAAEDLEIDAAWISWCITQNREYKGYTFKKVVDLQ